MKKKNDSVYQSKFWRPIPQNDIILNKALFQNYGFDKHIHEEYAIGVIGQGCIDGFLDGSTKLINKSSIMTINPDTAHSNWAHDNSTYSQSALYLNPSFLSTLLEENFKSKPVHFKSGLIDNESLANEFLALTSSYETGDLSSLDFECQLIDILNKILLINTTANEQKTLSKHDLAIYRAKEFMQDNLDVDLTLDNISEQLDISKYHFLRLFKEHTHFSPHAYLMLKRIEKAKKLLQKANSLVDVAYSCGFNDQSHLTKRFKAVVGITPGEYQKFFI